MKTIRSRLLGWGRILLAVAILFLLIKRLHQLLGAVEMESITLKPFSLFASLTLLLAYLGTHGIACVFLYQVGSGKEKRTSMGRCLTHKDLPPLLSGWAFFQLSQFGRYLPGKVGQFVVMFSLSQTFGIEKKGAVLATCCHLVFQCGLGCFIGFFVLRNTAVAPLWQELLTDLQMSGKTVLLIGSIVGMTLGISTLFFYRQRIRDALSYLMKQDFRPLFLISSVLGFISGYLLLWGLFGTAFFLFIHSIHPVDASEIIIVTGIYAVAWIIGFLSFLTPSGLGVREGVLSLLLTTILPPATATLVALLSRLWTLSAELFLGGLAFGIYFRQRRVQSP
ncbi:MAG: hypothetical protein OXU51_20840 [Candidatus Poribacteria bacterium]|nr:hypothetical protein [Candidatus Poribacteria bacterium]